MTESLTLEGLTFTVSRSSRRQSIGITIEREGVLSVVAPTDTPLDTIESAVRKRLLWVFTKLAEKALLFSEPPDKEYISGTAFHYLGRSYRLLLIDQPDAQACVRLTGGRFTLPRHAQAQAAALLTDWYTTHALAWLQRSVARWTPRIGKEPVSVQVRELGYRWGSCTPEGVLNFHWRVICLPPTLIEYVVVHEMVHLLEPRHDAAFWHRLERVLPDWRSRKRVLAETGSQF